MSVKINLKRKMRMSKVKNTKMYQTQARFNAESWEKLNELSEFLNLSKMKIIRESFEIFSSVLGSETDVEKATEILKTYHVRTNILKQK
jgi:predicted DNA-binding protein